MATLLDNASATGSAVAWSGGQGLFTAEGTFGGATVKLQFKSVNGTWIDVGTDTELTAAGMGRFFLPPGELRANVAGGTPSALFVYALQFGV